MGSELWLRFDIRGAGLAVGSQALCAAAIEQAVWAEHNGFQAILFSEHHGSEDGYCPSPMILASAIAARTNTIRLHLGALVLPLSHPLRLAEDVCVLDNISNGRVDVTVGAGYVPAEFEMFGVDIRQRARLMDEGIIALRSAFTSTPFTYHNRQVHVTPAPVQPGGPKIYVAGAVRATALRAARLGDGFFPTVYNADLMELYRTECDQLGKVPFIIDMSGPVAIHVSRDPERDWARVGPHMLHELNMYGRWARASGTYTPFQDDVNDLQTLKSLGIYCIVRPEECVDLFERERAAGRHIMFNPLCGGLHPDIAWESLELMAAEVLPHLSKAQRH